MFKKNTFEKGPCKIIFEDLCLWPNFSWNMIKLVSRIYTYTYTYIYIFCFFMSIDGLTQLCLIRDPHVGILPGPCKGPIFANSAKYVWLAILSLCLSVFLSCFASFVFFLCSRFFLFFLFQVACGQNKTNKTERKGDRRWDTGIKQTKDKGNQWRTNQEGRQRHTYIYIYIYIWP